jgi:hypothetical protein
VGRKVALSWNIAESVAISTLGLRVIFSLRGDGARLRIAGRVRPGGKLSLREYPWRQAGKPRGRPILCNTIVEQNTASVSRATGCQRCLAARSGRAIIAIVLDQGRRRKGSWYARTPIDQTVTNRPCSRDDRILGPFRRAQPITVGFGVVNPIDAVLSLMLQYRCITSAAATAAWRTVPRDSGCGTNMRQAEFSWRKVACVSSRGSFWD